MGRIVVAGVKLGYDLKELVRAVPGGQKLIDRYQKIGDGIILAEVAAVFHQHPRLVDLIGGLTHDWQRKLASGKKIPVSLWANAETITTEMKSPDSLTPPELTLVFDGGRVRTPEEQAVILRRRRSEAVAGRHTEEIVGGVFKVGVNGIEVLKRGVVAPELLRKAARAYERMQRDLQS